MTYSVKDLGCGSIRFIIYQHLKSCKYRCSKISRSRINDGPRFFISRNDNPQFFQLLDDISIFDFYSTNGGDIIGVSQVVAFIFCGGWAAYYHHGFYAPKDQIEVHHYNGNVQDNRPENLVYLSRQDHQYVSNCTYTPFYGKVEYEASTPFNRQGKPIKNKKHFLANVLKATLSCLSIRHTGKKTDLAFSKILKALPRKLWETCVNYYRAPQWLSKQILLSCDPTFNLT